MRNVKIGLKARNSAHAGFERRTTNDRLRWMALTACLLAGACRLPAADSVTHTWPFASGANPASSDSAAGAAAITPGQFGAGWVSDLPGLSGGSGGYWDLGQAGTIACSFANGVVTNGTVQSLKVRVAQWWDGGIYGDFATVAVPGAHQTSTSVNVSNLGTLGGWIVDETVWAPNGAAALNAVNVTGRQTGSVIDSLTIEAVVAVQPPQLTICMLGGNQIELSWPAANSSMLLESTADISGTPAWGPVEADVQVGETTCTAVTTADGPARFYRLRQP